MQPRLIGLSGPVMGLTVNLSAIETTLGREAGNTAVLNSASVSRRHARVIAQGSGFAIEDLGSANGVRVNGMSIAGLTQLKNGDRIDLGEVALLYESPESVPPAPAAAPRKPEVGSVERAAHAASFAPPSRGATDAFGCNPLSGLMNDLSGILPGIMKYLIPVALGLLALFCLFSLLVMGIGAIGALLHHGSSTQPAATGPAQGNGQGQGQSGKTPPPSGSSDDSQGGSGNAKISILSTRVIRVVGANQVKTPTLLVKWRNDSDQPVTELDGTVILHLPDGHSDAYPKMRIYVGAPIQPGQVHEDTGSNDGVAIPSDADPAPEVVPSEVK